MDEPELGSIDKVRVRDVWPDEAQNFTPWLAQNIDGLSDALGFDIEIEEREAPVGSFAVDLFGKEVGTGRAVIIENQLERTDHSHLGQLIAYAAGLEAKVVVWVSPEVRDEHKEAIHWLNSLTDDIGFFAVELEVWRIGDSLRAPRFNVVERPSGFQRQIVRETTAAPSERGIAYQSFFRDLVERLHAQKPGFTRAVPDLVRYDNWTAFGSGRSGFSIDVVLERDRDRFSVGITTNTGSQDRNKLAFDELHRQRDAIEHALGQPLTWERRDERVQSRIAAYRDHGIDAPSDVIEESKQWAVDLLPKFRAAFEPRIKALDLDALAADYANEEAAT